VWKFSNKKTKVGMSNSAILSSSIAKKYWMALTGLFLCLFLVGHLLGNLQLIFITGEEGKLAFNEYAYFMTHNPLIKVMSWLTYLSIIFHAVDGILLTIQNKKARPIPYAHNNPSANSSFPSRNMALLGSLILIFIATHMANFWWKMKYSSDPMPLHTETIFQPERAADGKIADVEKKAYRTTSNQLLPVESFEVRNGNELYAATEEMRAQISAMDPTYNPKGENPRIDYAYKDLHSVVLSFFGHDKTKDGVPAKNDMALFAVIFYVFSMIVMGFHLWHGFASSFQSLGLNHKGYNNAIKLAGRGFAVLIPALFAIIPVILFMTK
jgi:succinate dehydrogenase / fumarate reductase cytochrome b subunit